MAYKNITIKDIERLKRELSKATAAGEWKRAEFLKATINIYNKKVR